MHYPLPAQDASSVKGNRNQQDIILKALKDCGKVRGEDAQPFAPAYILQKVWPSGLDSLTTKGLRQQFAKDLGLNILLDVEVSKLRDTIRRGLTEGQWDMKVGEQLYIKTANAPLTAPTMLEFSERIELYRRGILQPPEPRVIELSAQVMAGGGEERKVEVRWRAKEALKISLYKDQELLGDAYLPSDAYEGRISQTTQFRLVADYGNGEVVEKLTTAGVYAPGSGPQTPSGQEGTGTYGTGQTSLLDKPTEFELTGSVNKVFNDLADRIRDDQIRCFEQITLAVDQVIDYRKLGTTLPLLARYSFEVEQFVTIQTGQQFVRLEYQGDVRGFQSFFSTINGLLNQPEVQANLTLKIVFTFDPAVAADGPELKGLQQALQRNSVERMSLLVRVDY